MRYYYRDKDWLWIGFEYRPYLVAEMKKFKCHYNPATKEWYTQLNLENSSKFKGFLENNGFVNKKVIQPRDIELKPIHKMIDEELLKEMVEYLNFPMTPRPYQIEGITYMINHGNCINGCQMGLGKSAQSLLCIETLDLFPCLIICPSTVKSSWLKEWNRWNPKRSVHIIDSKDSENTDWKADVTVINYDYLYKRGKSKNDIQLRYTRSLSKKWGAVILDEVHLCKNPKSLRSKAVMKIVEKANKVYALSGTVVMNRPQELINILKIIGRFDIFPDLKYFLYRYCNARMTRFGLDSAGASYTSELYEIINHYCYFRKNKNEVLTELPEVIEQVIDSPITNTKEYKKAEDDLIAYLEEFDIEAAERAKRAEHLVRIANLKKLSLKGKLKFIIQFLKDWKEADEELKVLIFGTLTEPLEHLHKEFKKDSELIIGQTSTEEKMARVERWKKSKQFLFANIATLSTGVDGLQQVCSNMIFIEYPNGPSHLEQAIARLDRMGQKNSTNVYYIMSQDTIDVRIKEILDEKTIITNAVNKGIENVSSSENVSLDIALLKKYKASIGQ